MLETNKWSNIQPLSDFSKIKEIPWTRYKRETYQKTQIVLHHTVSGDRITGDLKTWEQWRSIATSIIIDRDGTINQLFSSKYWAHHIGAGSENLDKMSIGVELDNWGGLVKGNGDFIQFGKRSDGSPNIVKTNSGDFYAAYGNKVSCPVTEYETEFRGYTYFESYPDVQLISLGELLRLWNQRYMIPLTYHPDMWQKTQNALQGMSGVWAHVSYRNPEDKQDAHPQPELIEMLKTIENIN